VQGSEVVYVRENDMCPAVRVKVWTTIDARTGMIRQKGRDAIRISAAYEGRIPLARGKDQKPSTNYGIYKTPRVNRTGEEGRVLDRVYAHMREAYSFTNEWIRNHWRVLGDQCHEITPADGSPPTACPADGGPADGGPADGGSADGGPPTAGPADGSPADGSPADDGHADGGHADGGPSGSGLKEDDYE
jgi:hypothetical protein